MNVNSLSKFTHTGGSVRRNPDHTFSKGGLILQMWRRLFCTDMAVLCITNDCLIYVGEGYLLIRGFKSMLGGREKIRELPEPRDQPHERENHEFL